MHFLQKKTHNIFVFNSCANTSLGRFRILQNGMNNYQNTYYNNTYTLWYCFIMLMMTKQVATTSTKTNISPSGQTIISLPTDMRLDIAYKFHKNLDYNLRPK